MGAPPAAFRPARVLPLGLTEFPQGRANGRNLVRTHWVPSLRHDPVRKVSRNRSAGALRLAVVLPVVLFVAGVIATVTAVEQVALVGIGSLRRLPFQAEVLVGEGGG